MCDELIDHDSQRVALVELAGFLTVDGDDVSGQLACVTAGTSLLSRFAADTIGSKLRNTFGAALAD